MPRRWLSFRDEKTRPRRTGEGTSGDAEIYVPYGQGKLGKGDSVYCVAVEESKLVFFCRVIVARIARDPEHAEGLDVWAGPGSAWCEEDCVVGDDAVDELAYLDAGGKERQLPRDASGALVGDDFRGPSSIRELARGGEVLDRLGKP